MTYSTDIKNLFLDYYLKGISLKEISKNINVSLNALYKWKIIYSYNIENEVRIEENFDINIPKRSTNKKCKYIKSVVDYVNDNIGCSLNNIHEHVCFGISKTTINTILKENKISHKRFKTHIVGKDIEIINNERINFVQNINKNDFMNSIHIDETSIDLNVMKNYGYAPKNKKIKKIIKHKINQERYTLLQAITKNGVLESEIIKGTVNAEIYLNFIKKISLNPFYKNKNIYQDNARIHHALIVMDYCKKNNINMKFNPAYTPEYNPIELIFNQIKTNYKSETFEYIEEGIMTSFLMLNKTNFRNSYNHTWKIISDLKNECLKETKGKRNKIKELKNIKQNEKKKIKSIVNDKSYISMFI